MKKCLSVLVAVCMGTALHAQVISYDLASIPEAVKKDADVIKRYEDIYFEVTDIDRASMKVQQVYTVLNEEGKGVLSFHEYTSKFWTLGDVDIKVFDALGHQTVRYKKKDLATISIGDGLVDDGKTYYITIPATAYPVTVSYEYDKKYKGTLFYPVYEILEPDQGVVTSNFTAKVPKTLDLREIEILLAVIVLR